MCIRDRDSLDDFQDSIALITLHQAKGLEFPTVFIVGLEEGLLPHIRSFDYADQMEEERRVFYVGMTRAKECLYITRSFRRGYRGNGVSNVASRFLMDIPSELMSHFSNRSIPLGSPVTNLKRQSDTSYLSDHPVEQSPMEVGQKVRHDRFGDGIVVSCTAIVYDYQLTVAFKADGGVRNLLLGYANLELLD